MAGTHTRRFRTPRVVSSRASPGQPSRRPVHEATVGRLPGPADADASLPAGLGPARPVDPTWCVVVDGNEDDGFSAVAESLLCLADGTIGTRGVLEDEPRPAMPAVAAAGLYEPAPEVGQRLMPLPPWSDLPLAAGLPPGRRVLDLRDGVLTRVVADEQVVLRTARFGSITHPGTAVLAAEVDRAALVTGATGRLPKVEAAQDRSPLGGGVAVATATDVSPLDGVSAGVVEIERMTTYVVTPRAGPQPLEAARRLAEARLLGAAELLRGQRGAWARQWRDGDVEIVGDPEMTLAIRFALFHVLCSAARSGEAAVGARGLTGPAYAGHVFWDTEAFVAPVLAAVAPTAARAVLEYRIRRLDPARARAAGQGRQGARFPWESAWSGDDVTPHSGIDQHGDQVPIRTGDLEEHVTADVAWAAWRLASWRGDWSFLEGRGRPLVVESARYWASRLRRDVAGRAHIDSVIGPDEYHEDVDDNAFTNLMASWNLRRAAELVERRHPTDEGLEEAVRWHAAADALVDNYDPGATRHEQFAGYSRLDPLMVSDLGRPPLAADLILGSERLARTQVIKQADVLMAHFLIPEAMPPGSLAGDLDYYLPRTAHGSSLSPSVHAALLARARRPDEALELLRTAAAIDVEDLTETTAGGLHLANLGGMWQAIVHGFAGLSVTGPDDRALVLDPHLPTGWPELRLRLRWHGHRIHLVCRPDAVHVGCDSPLDVVVAGSAAKVEPPGRWVG